MKLHQFKKSHYNHLYRIIKSLTKPEPYIYWGDLILTAVSCYGLMYLCMKTPISEPTRWIYFFLCSFFVNRGIYFIHEVVHQGKFIKGFTMAQNILFGCVFKFPSYIHQPHHDHHRITTYGTIHDPEYDETWIGRSASHYYSIFFISLLIPLLLILRFGILPIFYPFMSPDLKNKIFQKASTFAMNPNYIRSLPTKEEYRSWMFQDTISSLINGSIIVLFITNHISLENFITFHLFGSTFFFFNFFRALVAHKYNVAKDSKTIESQVDDSISIPNSYTDFFWAPLGLKYHSLHHYFPTIPYHNLKKAHQLLTEANDEIYLSSLEPSLPNALHKAFKGNHEKPKKHLKTG